MNILEILMIHLRAKYASTMPLCISQKTGHPYDARKRDSTC